MARRTELTIDGVDRRLSRQATLSVTNTNGGIDRYAGRASDAGTINTPDTANNTTFVGIKPSSGWQHGSGRPGRSGNQRQRRSPP
jgi:hypothetical protein